ncbi:MAG: hypothetical protein A2Z14_09590 [Chloroflexi bacterium RBG_16_48_8]|nr:MAG: hypothetical protein A2Z14_09590 [Chloroflexi bacterium RBG_16_48_8]
MEALGGILSAFGLSVSAGLNAYVPLLIVALIARFTNWIELGETWNTLTSWWVIGALVVLGLIEFFADKVPAVNHINDAVQTFIRPTAGAVLFAASTDVVTNIHPVIALIAGLLISGGVHAVKSAAIRPAVTVTTGGAGNIPVSIAEDVVATVLSILAVVLPVVIAALIVLVTAWAIWLLWRRANRTHNAEWD